METQTIDRLVGSGNVRDFEQAWMTAIEKPDVDANKVLKLLPIVDELVNQERRDQAGSLAWAAVETLKEKRSPAEALKAAKPLLLKLKTNDDLKRMTTELFREVHGDRENLEELLEEAGIAGGRPPRRALRTLDVVLSIEPGSYVVSRDDHEAAKVESVDLPEWEVTFNDGEDSETLGPVHFADRYEAVQADDIRVLAKFDRDTLDKLLNKEPAAVIEKVMKIHGHSLDSDDLESLMTRQFLQPSEWSKWWTKARAAIKKSRQIKLEGRTPYRLEYIPGGHEIQEEFVKHVLRLESPAEQLDAFETFISELNARNEPPEAEVLKKVRDMLADRAKRLEKLHATPALAEWLVEAKIAEAVGDEDPDKDAIATLAGSDDPVGLLRGCESAPMWRCANGCIQQARPTDWAEVLIGALPWAPGAVCDEIMDALEKSDLPGDEYERSVNTIVSAADDHFEALCWLWDKGLNRERLRSTPPVTILTRVLSLLGDVQRSDRFSSAVGKQICSAARSALSARRYSRFEDCLANIEQGMASALRTQIQRLDNLGPKVHDDLLNRIRRAFPDIYKKAHTPRWAQEEVIYATMEGIRKWEAEINELVNVKMVENARAIGAAAEKGDLSENSEYKFALEERDLLRSRLANMREQAGMAKPLTPEEVPADHVSVGSKVTLRHVQSGTTIDLTFLSPFEANAEAHIYNYKAPLAQETMGLSIGDTVELSMMNPPGTYEVAALSPWKS